MEEKEHKHIVEGWSFLNGEMISHDIKEIVSFVSSSDSIYQSMLKNIGIGRIDSSYVEVNEIQDKNDEYSKILRFLELFVKHYTENKGLAIEDVNLEFINYGRTELVYVLTEKSGERVTLLVKQPAVRLGEVYQEMQNLLELKEKDDSVVAPIDYFQVGDQELYVTPYINQARCVASDGTWGMYVPEPVYRFVPFSKEQEKIVNTCMIAKLVSLYDHDRLEGISCCKLGGGDFMLEKGWEQETPTIEGTLNQMYLIAARSKVKCSFEEYLDMIRKEFSKATIKEDQSQLVINLRGRAPMNPGDIEDGINLGVSLSKKGKRFTIKRNGAEKL